MIRRRKPVGPLAVVPLLPLLTGLLALAVLVSGCKSSSHTSDSRLQEIDEMLSAQLPPGTPRARVSYFLSSRGYIIQDARDKNSLVAIVRHVDTETLQPATARVTFRFDSNEKLVSFELQRIPDAPFQP
jgi:hypothetical protein